MLLPGFQSVKPETGGFQSVKPETDLIKGMTTQIICYICSLFVWIILKMFQKLLIGEFSIVFIYASPLPALMEYQPSHQNCENTQLISTTDAQHKIWLRGTESKWCHRSWYKLLVDHLPFVAAHLLRLDMEDGIWVLISHAKLRSGLNKRYDSDIYYKYIQTTIDRNTFFNHM